MGQILRNWRVITATLLSAAFVVGSFILARGIESPSRAQASEEAALLQAIAAKDSDSDGLTDWEEALYGTDPHKIDTLNLGMPDGDAVAKGLVVPKAIAEISLTTGASSGATGSDGLPPPPAAGTLTAVFTQKLLESYLFAKQAKGEADLSQSEMNDVINQALDSLSSITTIAPDYKSAKDIAVSGSGADALTLYAASVEAIFAKNAADATTSEILYLKRALEKEDTTVFPHIAALAKSYRDTAVGLAMISVPVELAEDHLALVNALMHKSEIAGDFARLDADPLAAILALEQYPEVLKSLASAFMHIGGTYQAANISLPAEAPGASFVSLVEGLVASQVSGKKP